MYLATYSAVRRFEFMADTADDARSGLREALEARWKRFGTPTHHHWYDDIEVRRLPAHALLVDGEEEN